MTEKIEIRFYAKEGFYPKLTHPMNPAEIKKGDVFKVDGVGRSVDGYTKVIRLDMQEML